MSECVTFPRWYLNCYASDTFGISALSIFKWFSLQFIYPDIIYVCVCKALSVFWKIYYMIRLKLFFSPFLQLFWKMSIKLVKWSEAAARLNLLIEVESISFWRTPLIILTSSLFTTSNLIIGYFYYYWWFGSSNIEACIETELFQFMESSSMCNRYGHIITCIVHSASAGHYGLIIRNSGCPLIRLQLDTLLILL